MKKWNPATMKWLKIVHLILVTLFFGGIMSSVALNFGMSLHEYEETLDSYQAMVRISDQIIRIGAVGTLLVGFVYGIFTSWGFFRHRWITVKWVLFLIQTLIGIFIVDKLMVANMGMLESQHAQALTNPAFIQNHEFRQYAVIIQIGITLFIIAISVIKPLKKKKSS
ncbi:DUF2269 family protein [Paenibacillus terrigena]|uniref:DUF2269 family protein n=1 Tax=Paenibacillus terrigena TaxID=369333 RepID=UPI00035CEAF1|nr:DUF2269 family protein [Paenibacillus terrigena]